MTVITTAKVDPGIITNWDRPTISTYPPTPYMQIEHVNQVGSGVASKITTNTSKVTLACALPRNFVWLPVDIRIRLESNAIANIDGTNYEDSWACEIQNSDGPVQGFQLQGQDAFFASDATGTGDDDFMREYVPINFPHCPVNCDKGDGSLAFRIWDMTGTTTGVVTLFWYVRSLGYTVEQYRKFPMHTPIPTVGAL